MIKYLWCLLLIPTLSSARWATHDDAVLQLNDFNRKDEIHADGTFDSEVEEEIEVLKEGGRETATVRRLYYNESAEQVSILEAYSVTEGQKHKVDLSSIEDKPMASFGAGFDQIRQVLIVYPHVGVGSKTHLKYKVKTNRVPLEKAFCNTLFWGQEYYWKKSQTTLKSVIPLKIKINDPHHALRVKETHTGKIYSVSITQKKPLYTEVVNDGQWINYQKQTWVSFSSFKNWEEIARRFSEGWEKILSQPLPARFELVEKEAAQKVSEVDQINKVTSLLSEAIQYMGDWRTVEGRLWPRDLDRIAITHVGDCKDFSAVTIAILRRLGFQAYAVLVNRGVDARDFEGGLPCYDGNHAMVKAIGKSGQVYWVDPTNRVSMAQGIFPDIAGKRALVLNPQDPISETIPSLNAESNQLLIERQITIQKDCSIDVAGKAVLKGESALEWAGKGLEWSPKGIEEELIKVVVGKPLDKEDPRTVSIPDLTKRVVEDVTFKYSYHQQYGVKRTNRGYYFEMDPLFSVTTAEDQVSDMFLGPAPFTIKMLRLIKGSHIENINLLNAEITTPWIEMKRICTLDKGDLRVEDILIFKTKFILAKDLHSLTYKKMIKDLKFYFDVGIILDRE